MIDEHRRRGRHDNLMQPLSPDDDPGGWMISYIDVMTLLVALLVLILALGGGGAGVMSAGGARVEDAVPKVEAPRHGVPLPEPLRQLTHRRSHQQLPPAGRSHQQLPPTGRLLPAVITTALGVAGPPDRMPRPPRPNSTASIVLPGGLDLTAPLAGTLLILTDNAPGGFEEVDEEAIAGARFVSQALPEAAYLPDLEGMEVSRIPEGVRLRVEDRLLFPTADAELTDTGVALVTGRLRELIQRYPGDVAVEGHSDSRPISTERFPSNWALSSGRAIAIVEALVAAGVEPSRLRAVGLADTRPLQSNETAEGRSRNRRVEVMIQAQ